MAGIKDIDFDAMTSEEGNAVYAKAPFRSVRIIFSTALIRVFNRSIPSFIETYVNYQDATMRSFCREAAKQSFDLDFEDLLLETYRTFFTVLTHLTAEHSRRAQTELNEMMATRLSMNYYRDSTHSLTLCVDLLPIEVRNDVPMWKSFQELRQSHEFGLNSLH